MYNNYNFIKKKHVKHKFKLNISINAHALLVSLLYNSMNESLLFRKKLPSKQEINTVLPQLNYIFCNFLVTINNEHEGKQEHHERK